MWKNIAYVAMVLFSEIERQYNSTIVDFLAASQQTPDVPGRQGMSYFGQVKTDVLTMTW